MDWGPYEFQAAAAGFSVQLMAASKAETPPPNFRKYSSNAMIVLALLKQSGLQWAEVPTSSQSQRAEDKDFLNCLDSPKENKCFCSSQTALQ